MTRGASVSVAVDCVVFGFEEEAGLQILLIERGYEPFAGRWALPGGFVEPGEGLDAAALRELSEETAVSKIYLEQLYTFGAPDRDPRGRVISVAYYALVRETDHAPQAGSDARRARWFPVHRPPPLAFDHAEILAMALRRLQGKVRYEPIGFELLPRKFTLSQLQRLYEAVLGRELDKRNFRKKILGMELLAPLEETETDVAHRAARLYQFDEKRYRRLVRQGFVFEV